jgi:hypothetical protein
MIKPRAPFVLAMDHLKPDALALAVANAHERDARILFDEVAHVYWIDGKRYPGSVSGLVHEYFPEFDAVATIENGFERWRRNKENKYYPLISYLTGVVGFSDELAKLEIARNWSAAGARASGDGTDTHLQIELCLNGEPHNADQPEFRQYEAWRATHPTWKPYRTEWSVFDEDTLVCGQIDSLWVDNEGLFHMADWKRVEEMKMDGFRGETGRHPLTKLPATNWGHYVLQQATYAWMLEKNYGIKVASMCLVQIHPILSQFREHVLPRIDAELATIMGGRRALVEAGELVALDAVQVAASAHKRSRAEVDETERKALLAAHLRRLLADLERV